MYSISDADDADLSALWAGLAYAQEVVDKIIGHPFTLLLEVVLFGTSRLLGNAQSSWIRLGLLTLPAWRSTSEASGPILGMVGSGLVFLCSFMRYYMPENAFTPVVCLAATVSATTPCLTWLLGGGGWLLATALRRRLFVPFCCRRGRASTQRYRSQSRTAAARVGKAMGRASSLRTRAPVVTSSVQFRPQRVTHEPLGAVARL